MNVFLIGFMACGKNTIGRKLAARLDCKLLDTDNLIEESFGLSVAEIFSRYGEAAFREREARILRTIPSQDLLVVTGGGLPCFGDNMDWIGKHGKAVYLHLSPKVLFSRLKQDANRFSRPLLAGLDDEQLLRFITDTLSEREKHYRKAQRIFNPLQDDFPNLVSQVADWLAE